MADEMSAGDLNLWKSFPCVTTLNPEETARIVAFLLSVEEGTSFAVTADGRPGVRHLWMSQDSFERMLEAGGLMAFVDEE